MPTVRLVRSALLCLLVLTNGCSLLKEEAIELPRGTRIPVDQIPASVVPSNSLPSGTTVELHDDGSHRIEYPGGTIQILNCEGKCLGGVL